MATRIHQSIVRGEIDNRERGQVKGRIWLAGRDQPVALELSGNCQRDLAGCRITFENPQATPNAIAEELPDLDVSQTGVAGDITASRRVRVFTVPVDEALRMAREGGTPPERTANAFYLEWFSDANGRVVIESADYQIAISDPTWTLSPEEEQEQIEASQQAMRDWLDRLDQALQFSQLPTEFEAEDERPMDEFGYEKLMRESDARTDKYMALLEKYEGHPDQEKIVAREMGWEWLEEALEANERGALPVREEFDLPPLEPNPATEGIDWVRDEDDHIQHPLAKQAFDRGMSMWHFCNDRGLLADDGDPDLHDMIFQFQTTGAKLAGALNSLAYDDENSSRDGGFVVAALKRALNYLHTSMAAAEKVVRKNRIDGERLAAFRADLFDTREQILALMQRYRER